MQSSALVCLCSLLVLALTLVPPAALASSGRSRARAAKSYMAPPAEQVPGYPALPLPCQVVAGQTHSRVTCHDGFLEGKSLRELILLRNTLFARQGLVFRTPWLSAYFERQPWYRPDPKASIEQVTARLTQADRLNERLIFLRERSLTEGELLRMQATVHARAGKVFGDVYTWRLANGRTVRSCEKPAEPLDEEEECTGSHCDAARSWDCFFRQQPWYQPDPGYSDARLSADDLVELGLIRRALGPYASDSLRLDALVARLEQRLSREDLLPLSLRDLYLLRNSIYARRGRTFVTPVLREHFTALRWYSPDAGYTDERLTEVDRYNAALILGVESELAGPLKEEDWSLEPPPDEA